jgi:hypothetical protein
LVFGCCRGLFVGFCEGATKDSCAGDDDLRNDAVSLSIRVNG